MQNNHIAGEQKEESRLKLINTMLRIVSLNQQLPSFCFLLAFDQVFKTISVPIFGFLKISIEHFALKMPSYSPRKDEVEENPVKLILHQFFCLNILLWR